MILAFSDLAWNGLFGALATVIVAWIVNRAAKKQEVKIDKVEVKVEKVAEVAKQTLTHVNSGKGLQLKLGAVSARRLAGLTKNKADIEAATLAEKLLTEHEKEQVVVDAATEDRKEAAQPSMGNISPM